MASLIESPQVALVSGSNFQASSRFSLSRLILPILGVAIGVSAGSAAGLTLALVNAPNNTVAASSEAIPASPTSQASPASADAVTSVAMTAQPAPIVQPAVSASPAANFGPPATGTVHSIANPAAANSANVSLSSSNLVAKAHAPSTVQIALNQTPDAVRPAMFRLAGKQWHVAIPVAIPVAQPVRRGLANAPAVASSALDAAQSGLEAAAKPASLYTEGDLTVADFDSTDGTLQASDGRTFILGTTVAASYATSWDSYRSLVHYRCDQAGSCVLMRAGAVAPNARLI